MKFLTLAFSTLVTIAAAGSWNPKACAADVARISPKLPINVLRVLINDPSWPCGDIGACATEIGRLCGNTFNVGESALEACVEANAASIVASACGNVKSTCASAVAAICGQAKTPAAAATCVSTNLAAIMASCGSAEEQAAEKETYVPTPRGYAPKECVFSVGNGAHISETSSAGTVVTFANGSTWTVPPCARKILPPDTYENSWQVYTQFQNKNNNTFTSFLGSFSVPNKPKHDLGQILYVFTGLQDDSWVPANGGPAPAGFDIIQPVLQFGSTPAGGGSYWAIASWYVTLDDSVVFSDLVEVSPGDNIFGNMTMTSSDEWFIGSRSDKTNVWTNTTISRPRLASQPWAFNVLETYNVEVCSQYPTENITFTGLELADETGAVVPVWAGLKQYSKCGQKIVVNSPEKVTVVF